MKHFKGKNPVGRIRSKYVRIALVIVALVVAMALFINDYSRFEKMQRAIDGASDSFSVHYIDVGQGDATLLRSPSGGFMLIDCGPSRSGGYLVKYLSDMGVKKLDYLVITHPHEDHYGGAYDVMDHFTVEELVIHRDFKDTYPFDKYIKSQDYYGYEVHLTQLGETFKFDGCADFEIIAPEEVDYDDLNESSLGFRVVYEDTAFMFTGDAEWDTESFMLSSGKPLKADVLQAGHHGSSTSNTRNFVKAVDPDYAVISCEKNNDYGHPHKETVETFEKQGVKMLRTDTVGSVVFLSDGKEVTCVENFLEKGGADSHENKENMFIRYLNNLF